MYSGLYFVRSYNTTQSLIVAYFLLILDLIVGSLVIVYGLYVARRVFKEQTLLMKKRLEKFLEKSNTGKSSFIARKLAKTTHSLMVALTPRNSSDGDSSPRSNSDSSKGPGDHPFDSHNLQIISSDDLLRPQSSHPLVDENNILNFDTPLGKSNNLSKFGLMANNSPSGSPVRHLSPVKGLSNFFPNSDFGGSRPSSLIFGSALNSPTALAEKDEVSENIDANELSMSEVASPRVGISGRLGPHQSFNQSQMKNYEQESWSPMCDEMDGSSVRRFISGKGSVLASPVGTPRNLLRGLNRDASFNQDLSVDSSRTIINRKLILNPHDSMIILPSLRDSQKKHSTKMSARNTTK